MANSCKSCGEPIDWAVTENDKMLPLNPGPDPAGNQVIIDWTERFDQRVPVVHQLSPTREEPEFAEYDRYMTHFETCQR